MSGVLPMSPPLSSRGFGVPHRGAHHGRARGALRPYRAPLNRGIRRTAECPCAVRLYTIGQDIAARSEYCSLVLGAPSVGITQAVQPRASTPAFSDQAAAPVCHGSSSIRLSSDAVERPIAVQLAWADTTVWEVALTALRAVRSQVDAAFKATAPHAMRHGCGRTTAPAPVTQSRQRQKDEEDDNGSKEDEEEAPYSTPLPRYHVELLTGTVSPEGRASLLPLCTVSCRQVVHCHSALLPVRSGYGVDYNTALYELPYNLGDPVFVTCTRTR
ncbi:hypothetical protein LSCM1_06027 [Leishmania martiniquensis]|uniref:Uncharacterized protein n=1 Tax=Leishmania martiniquensis TaxID=1580590 RepID=A0A836KK23_9TRYP|nr:hypothetical protein LSCM1_06027 [Leishmania martiniquensis]